MSQYTARTWTTGDTITAAELNALEQAAAAALPATDAATVAKTGLYSDLAGKPTLYTDAQARTANAATFAAQKAALLVEAAARRHWRIPYPNTTQVPSWNTSSANATTSAHVDPVYYAPTSSVFRYKQGHVTANTATATGTRGNTYVQSDQSTTPGYVNMYAAEFITTATTVEIGYLGTAFPQFRVWIDDAIVNPTQTTPWASKLGSGTPFSPANSLIQMDGSGYHNDNQDHMLRVATNGSRQLRKWRIEFCNGARFGGVWIERVDSIQPTADARPRALVVGDSYTTGAGGDGPASGFAAVMGRYLGWDVWESGSGGTGYLQTNGSAPNLRTRLAADCYRFTPDVVVIPMGVNDDTFTAAAIGTEATAAYADIATNLPGTPVVVILPWRDAPGSVTAQFEIDRRTAIRTAAAAAPNVVAIVDPNGWITGTGTAGTRTVTDGATTSGSSTITSATANFTSANVGNNVSGAGIPAGAYIGAVTNTTTATLYVAGVAANATATATGVTLTLDGARRDGNADFMIAGDNLHPKQQGHEWLGANAALALINSV